MNREVHVRICEGRGESPLPAVVRRGCATRRTSERWRHHDRCGGTGPVAIGSEGCGGGQRARHRPKTADNPRAAPSPNASKEGPAGRGPAPEGAVSAEIPPYAAQATPGQENRGPKDGG